MRPQLRGEVGHGNGLCKGMLPCLGEAEMKRCVNQPLQEPQIMDSLRS